MISLPVIAVVVVVGVWWSSRAGELFYRFDRSNHG
jgi:hypothetical protein